AYAQQSPSPTPVPTPSNGEIRAVNNTVRHDSDARKDSAHEIEELRKQLQQAQAQIEEVRAQMDAMRVQLNQLNRAVATADVAAHETSQPSGMRNSDTSAGVSPTPVTTRKQRQQEAQPSTIDELIKPKSQDGQFSGAEGLLKTDRLKIGGYADFRYVTRGIDEGFEIPGKGDEANTDQTEFTNFKRNGFLSPPLLLC